jgi:hypothetical protein
LSLIDAALATPGFGVLLGTAIVAGAVRGFAGFGSGMIFMPVAAVYLPPFWALVSLAVIDMIGPLPVLRRAARDAVRAEVVALIAGLLVGLPIGLSLLAGIPVEVFRWSVSASVMVMLVLLLAGWRYRGPRGPVVSTGAGWVAGFMGGAAGLAGPPVILYYLASNLRPEQMRANLMIFFFAFNAAMLILTGLMGRLDPVALVLGALLLVPFTLANLAGAAFFRPGNERVYRAVAYVLIAAAGVLGLPVLDGLLPRG